MHDMNEYSSKPWTGRQAAEECSKPSQLRLNQKKSSSRSPPQRNNRFQFEP